MKPREYISNEKSIRTMIIKIPCGKSSKNVFREKKYRSQYTRKTWTVWPMNLMPFSRRLVPMTQSYQSHCLLLFVHSISSHLYFLVLLQLDMTMMMCFVFILSHAMRFERSYSRFLWRRHQEAIKSLWELSLGRKEKADKSSKREQKCNLQKH